MENIRNLSLLSDKETASPSDELIIPSPDGKMALEGMKFIESLSDEDFRDLRFSDQLVIVSDLGKAVGEFSVSVSDGMCDGQSCLMVHASSSGSVDDVPCGTSVTAFVSKRLETLEQHHHEYVQLPTSPLDRKTIIAKKGEAYVIDMCITEGGQDTRNVSKKYSVNEMKGVITEGGNVLLLRILAKRGFPEEELRFMSLDCDLEICQTSYRAFRGQQVNVGEKTLEVIGIERKLHPKQNEVMTWRSFFTSDGHLVKRLQVGYPITMVVASLPEDADNDEIEEKPVFGKKPLNWEEDMEMMSKFDDIKEELKANHMTYISGHPELRNLLSDYLQFLLQRKPADILELTADYFEAFCPNRPKKSTRFNGHVSKPNPTNTVQS